MTLFDVALKVTFPGQSSPDSFFTDLTRRFPSASIFVWCNRENDVVEIVVRNPEEYPVVMEEIRAVHFKHVIEEISDERRLYLSVHGCRCMEQNTIVRHIGDLNILNIFPNMIENGWYITGSSPSDTRTWKDFSTVSRTQDASARSYARPPSMVSCQARSPSLQTRCSPASQRGRWKPF